MASWGVPCRIFTPPCRKNTLDRRTTEAKILSLRVGFHYKPQGDRCWWSEPQRWRCTRVMARRVRSEQKARTGDESLSAAVAVIKCAAFDYYPRLDKVRSFVSSRLSEHISLSCAAEVAAYEPTYFCCLFHRRVGITFTRWLTITRVSRAAELLRSQDYPISEVAHMVGFRSVRAFERAFKSVALFSPMKYKSAVRPS